MGCHACSNICPRSCIEMKNDNEGFWYPLVDYDKCIRCGFCTKVCPIMNKTIVQNGPKAYACINKNEEIRLNSSSGGIFTLIAEQVINNSGVVFGAVFGEDFAVIHKYIESKEELGALRGSKYVQSEIGDTYKQAQQFLKQGRQVLFTGTPCQISGLKSYLQKDYDNLMCIDIICHGVPSPKVWKSYVQFRENQAGSQPWRIAFRLKNEGWKRFSVSFLYKNDTEYQETLYKDLYMKAFLKNVCLRPSCYACEFKTLHRESDITLADFWGIQNILPEMDDDKGTSLVFVNSTNGELLLEKIKDKILYKEVDINQAIVYNSAAVKSAKYNPKRDDFFNELDKVSFDILIRRHCSDRISARIKRKAIEIGGRVLRKTGTLDIVKRGLGRKNT